MFLPEEKYHICYSIDFMTAPALIQFIITIYLLKDKVKVKIEFSSVYFPMLP